MRDRIEAVLLAAVLLIIGFSSAAAQENWRSRAALEVSAPGIVETIVPAQLVSRAEDGRMDLTLLGPDGHTRSFELYWREPVAEVNLQLTSSQVMLDLPKGLVWQATLPPKTATRQLMVQVAAKSYIGKVTVEGLIQGQWRELARNAAIFKADGTLNGRIDIPEAQYEQVRLTLSGYDPKADPQLSPIAGVTAMGRHLGKDYVEQQLALPWQLSETEAETIVEAALPGNGLWLRGLSLTTEAQFQGSWQLGRDTIANGVKAFIVISNGEIAHVDRSGQTLTLELDQAWPGRSLVLKLNNDHRYLGAVTALTVTARLPRLVFNADQPGRYTLWTGGAQKIAILENPGDSQRQVNQEVIAAAIEVNPQWQPSSLVERFNLKGAPFDPNGHTWRSPLEIAQPGYYRLILNLAALVQSNKGSIRIVQDNLQVPYIQGRRQNVTMEPAVQTELDQKTNQGRWIITLPGASDQWQYLTLHAEGIFQRTLHWEQPKPGNLGWQPWRSDQWENRDLKETAYTLDLSALPTGSDRLRLIVDNGDNQPIRISKITATYAAPTFYFLAQQAGGLWIYGGNPQAPQPRYDLSLVQNELLAELPQEVNMGDPVLVQSPGWRSKLDAAFTGTGWGLYAVLGLVTLVLIGVIVRLFPKGEKK